jgi:hypothetical protein
MFRNLLCGVAILFLFGCSTTTNSHTVGGFHNNMETGLSVYHQYVAIHLGKTKNGELVKSEIIFKADQNENLPSNIVGIRLSIRVINPYNQKFEVWENLEFKNLETDKIYLKHKKLRYISQPLPEELISVKMPFVLDVYSQVIFSVDILDENGNKLYSTYIARYKIGSEK